MVNTGFVGAVVLPATPEWPPVARQLRNFATALPSMADQAGDAIIAGVLIRKTEGHVLVPVIVGSHLRLRPLVAILAGGGTHGIIGMLIAVPPVPLLRDHRRLAAAHPLRGWGAAAGSIIDDRTADSPAESPGHEEPATTTWPPGATPAVFACRTSP